MKKAFLFFLVAISGLFFSCKHKDEIKKELEASKRTQLFIQNQSSFSVKSVKFNGATFEGKNADSFVLKIAEKGKIKLDGASSGYVYFSIIDSTNETEIKVRSNEVVTVEKDESNVFLITDNTLILPIGSTEKSTLFGIVLPARLKVLNSTSCNIEDMSFLGRRKKETLLTGDIWQTDFSDEAVSTLSFKLVNPKDNKTFDVSIEEKIKIKTGEIKELELNNASLVLCDGKTRAIGNAD